MVDYYYHFGEKFNEKITPKHMTKDNFFDRTIDKNKYLTNYAKNKALYNYDANIEYFKKLNKKDFNKELNNILQLYNFVQITDLSKVKGERGIYVLVLDEYRQFYIGQSDTDIRQRILRHFKIKMPFHRVLFIKYDTLPIDAFKPLDTTRIYVSIIHNHDKINDRESKLIQNSSSKYMLNKTIGGKADTYFDLVVRLTVGRIKKNIK